MEWHKYYKDNNHGKDNNNCIRQFSQSKNSNLNKNK